MKSLKGTETEKNLLKSFAGESQARNRYQLFSSKAKKEGYIQLSEIFKETAENERLHAKRYFEFLEGGAVEITATYPAGKVGTTIENLKASAAGEKEEWSELYPAFATKAEEEGFPEIAAAYRTIASVEKVHEERYQKVLKNIEDETFFKKNEAVIWTCSKCGYVFEGQEAPKICPACKHSQEYFFCEENK